MDDINWIGHASFLLGINGKKVYIDPFDLREVKGHADLILITHPHFDHLHPDSIRKIADKDTEIFVPRDSTDKIPVGKVTGVEPNKRYSALGIRFSTMPAYNNVKERLDKHPRSNGWVGYVIELDGGRLLYHTGDTDFIDEMRGLRVDIALLPMSGTYTMDVNDAIEAAKSMVLKQAIPMHYKAVLGKEGSDAAERLFKSSLKSAVLLKEIQEPRYSF